MNRARDGTLLWMRRISYIVIPPNALRDSGIEAVDAIMTTIEGGASTEDDRPAFIFVGYPAEMEIRIALKYSIFIINFIFTLRWFLIFVSFWRDFDHLFYENLRYRTLKYGYPYGRYP